jgi:hypothetical protein
MYDPFIYETCMHKIMCKSQAKALPQFVSKIPKNSR